MRHRLFHAIVVLGTTSCTALTSDPPLDGGPDADGSALDGAAETSVDAGQDASTTDAPSVETQTADTATPDACVEEGCGCFPCIK